MRDPCKPSELMYLGTSSMDMWGRDEKQIEYQRQSQESKDSRKEFEDCKLRY